MSHESPSPSRRLSALVELLGVMETLRSPSGCAWDRVQTFATIAPYTIEEAYEVADAIERGDVDDLRDELGDLLFQVVFHAQMASEQGAFDFGDVAQAISAKMIRRHPHVFARAGEQGGGAVATGDGLTTQWERIKSAERDARHAARVGPKTAPASLMDDIPRGLAALKRADKVQRRAARVGFDWTSIDGVMAKVREELSELEQAVGEGSVEDEPASNSSDSRRGAALTAAAHEHVAEELGDLLFSVANLARHLGVDADRALSAATAKFERRFKLMETAAAHKTTDTEGASPLSGLSAEELELLWADAKARMRASEIRAEL